ncbi:hypothetical protein BaRGS_00033292 [Batillaria attramentaria]|uniref:Sulfotransferase domain-containing protein n=1 Tax=Batillaria attramentaria TaxID=370345 RepID=A0ABD0JL14_9CAEN
MIRRCRRLCFLLCVLAGISYLLFNASSTDEAKVKGGRLDNRHAHPLLFDKERDLENASDDDHLDDDDEDSDDEKATEEDGAELSGSIVAPNPPIDPSQITEEAIYEDNTKVHVLLLAYMRTGSSMTGRILKMSRSGIFYWYEPLHMLERHFVTGGHPELPYRNKSLVEVFTWSSVAKGNVSALLRCDIENVYKGALLDGFVTYSAQTQQFAPCFETAKTTSAWRKCARDMTAACKKNYQATAIKCIRLTLERAVEVMMDDHKVKVIHLFRDPRAVLLSRHKLGYTKWRDLHNEATAVCARMARDLEVTPTLTGPDLNERYAILRYEDITMSPNTAVQRLYDFMGIKPSEEEVSEAIDMISEAKANLTSAQVAQAWRQAITLQDARIIADACHDVMKNLGYRLDFADETELKDLRVPAFGEPPPDFASHLLV